MDNLKPIKRPKPSDGEEELYQMQDEFLKSREEPSAKVINLRIDNKKNQSLKNLDDDNKSSKPRSKFAERRALLKSQDKLSTSSQTGGSAINPAINTDILSDDSSAKILQDNVQEIPKITSSIILGNIIEKKINKIDVKNFLKSEEISDSGFPSVFVINHNEPSTIKNNNSLFSQSLGLKSLKIPENVVKQEPSVSQESFMTDISQENQQKLHSMTQEEILEEKKKLESMLSPEMIKFLKARKNIAKKLPENIDKEIKMETDEIIKEFVDKKINDEVKMEESNPPEEVIEIVEKANEKGWVHMDQVENVKLEWMNDIPDNKITESISEEPYNARFDFNGILLPFKDETVPVNIGLHHHGDEPDRPGYSLQELVQLTRSSSQQQRCTALNTLGKIMEKSRKGLYDKVLEPPPLTALSSRDILFLLRVSLDDSSVAVVTAGLQALCSFLYNEADEICLDRLFGWKYEDGLWSVPELLPPKNDVDNYDELKDDEFAQLDVVAAAIRSDLILRIRFILSELKPPIVGVTAALEILTRLARHSCKVALNIACTPKLLEIIVKNFIPLTTDCLNNSNDIKNAYGVPQICAVRFCRVLLEYAGRPVADRLHNLKIINCLLSYSTSESGVAGLRLTIEALRLWKLIVKFGVAKDSISGAKLVLGTQLQLLLTNHNIEGSSELSCEYAAALISLSCYEDLLKPTIQDLLNKWTTQLSTIKLPTWCNTKLIAITLTAFENTLSLTLLKTNWFLNQKIYLKLIMSSNLLGKCILATDRDPSALPSLGALTQNSELQPILKLKSTFLLLSTIINIFNKFLMFDEIKKFIEQPDMIEYLEKLSKNNWLMINNWYTRVELYLLTGIVKASTKIELNQTIRDIILNIAIKLVSSLPGDAPNATKEILKIIFSNEKLTVQRLSNDLNSLKLNKNINENFLELPDNISSIYGVYVSFGSWSDPGMPKDWPYLPLVAAYTRQRNKIKWDDNDTMKIVILLSLELAMPELVQHLSPNLRFSRLILIYLCETIYLNENISILLKNVMKLFLKNYQKYLDFSKDVPGVSSFTDIFTSMCECFCANSYGDDGFSTVLLLPIAQRHDSYYRKLLWSEHAGALRSLRIKPENLLVSLDEYLYPLEEDPSLIEYYITALVRQTVRKDISPLMYLIALHHSANFLKGESTLAVKMRSKIHGLKDTTLANTLLNYSTK